MCTWFDNIAFQVDSDADTRVHTVKSEKKKGNCDLERGHFLLLEALDEDEAGNSEEAVQLYTESITLCIKAKKETGSIMLYFLFLSTDFSVLGQKEDLDVFTCRKLH